MQKERTGKESEKKKKGKCMTSRMKKRKKKEIYAKKE